MDINMNEPTVKVSVAMDPIALVVGILRLLAATYGSGIIQKAFQKFQAQEVSRKDFEDIAPNDSYSNPPKTDG